MLLMSIIFSSCKSGDSGFGKFFNDFYKADEKEVANAKLEELLTAMQNKDKEKLKSLFAKNALSIVDDFDASMNDLFDYYEGDYISYDDWEGAFLIEEENIDAWIKTIKPTYDIKTSKRSYRMTFDLRTVDTGDSDNIGLWSIDIIKAENDDLTYAYRGNMKYIPGINLDVKSEDDE